MGKITFKDYKKTLLAHYDAIKSDDVTGILLEPSPAQMRDLCSLKIDEGLVKKADEDLMRSFFETKKEDSLKLSVKHCNIDKLKPIISFLKRESDTENKSRVELAAILIDFTPRPYANFSGLRNELDDSASAKPEAETKSSLVENRVIPKKKNYKKGLYVLMGLIGFLSVGYVVKDKFMPEKQCMQWQNDHYEKVDCLGKTVSFKSSSIEPFKEELIALEKIEVCDTTTFFEGDKAIVFYCKVNGVPEYFNKSGHHPVTAKPLKAITPYIINKYVKK